MTQFVQLPVDSEIDPLVTLKRSSDELPSTEDGVAAGKWKTDGRRNLASSTLVRALSSTKYSAPSVRKPFPSKRKRERGTV